MSVQKLKLRFEIFPSAMSVLARSILVDASASEMKLRGCARLDLPVLGVPSNSSRGEGWSLEA